MSKPSPKERGLIKGALRRVFSRSDLRNSVLSDAAIQHSDPARPRVKNWVRCNVCGQPEAKSYCAVDHVIPIVPLNTAFAEMSLDDFVDRLWCSPGNLQAICPECHDIKTKAENSARRKHKKESK